MNRLLHYVRLMCLLIVGTTVSQAVQAQCTIKLEKGQKDNGCYPFAVKMRVLLSSLPSGSVPSKFDWNFGGAGMNNLNPSADSVLTYTYKTASPDTTKNFIPSLVVTLVGGKTVTCTGPQIKVWDHPVAKIKFPPVTRQCFVNNSFCYAQQSSESKSKVPIVRYIWDLGDGDTASGKADGSPLSGCHHYQAAGFYDVTLSIIDGKGCTDTKKETGKIQVLEDLAIKFRATTPVIGCAPMVVKFQNITPDTTNWHVRLFEWKFDDPKATPTNPNTDSKNWGGGPAVPKADQLKFVSHTYNDSGFYNPSFYVETYEGCTAKFVLPSGITVYDPRPVIKSKDTVCWSEAKGGVTFSVNPIQGATFTIFNFGDPPSGPANSLVNSWSGSHNFVKGAQNYIIRFTMIHPICGNFDTCKILYVGGPQARINIPKPPAPATFETFKPSFLLTPKAPYSMQTFYDVLSRSVCDRKIAYSTYTKTNKKDSTIDSTYCYAPVHKHNFYDINACDQNVLTGNYDSFTVKATGYKATHFYDSTEVDVTWDADAYETNPSGNPIPNANASFNLVSFLKYFDSKKAIDDFIRDSLQKAKSGLTPAQVDQLIFMRLYNKKIWPNKFNTISNESFNSDSFYDHYFNGTPPSKYNSIVGPKFRTDSFNARQKNPSIPSSPYNSLRLDELLWTTPGGILFEQNMHDSDKWSCEFPNLVRFTNNTIKWRYKNKQPDDQWPNPNPDKCLDGNWPWSSDSMVYFWDFGDNNALGCVSTDTGIFWVSKTDSTANWKTAKPWDCKYSSLAAPFHFYHDLKMANPFKPCYFPKMTVWDTINKCQDEQTLILQMGKPYAGYDTVTFCLMNFYIQLNFGPASNPPFKGFKLSGKASPCTGPLFRYKVDFKETIPGSCGEPPQHFWVVFDRKKADSIAKSNGDYVCIHNRHIDKKTGKVYYDTIWNLQWIPDSKINPPAPYTDPVSGGIAGLGGTWSWNENDEGCKDIEVVVQNGDCFDTFVYKKYMCINKLTTALVPAGSNYGNVTTYDPSFNDPTAGDIVFNKVTYPAGQYVVPLYDGNPATRLYGTNPVRVCGSPDGSGAATFTVRTADTTQDFITSFQITGWREELPAGDYYYTRPFWPNKPTLTPSADFGDSVTAYKDILYVPRVTTTNWVQAMFWNPTKGPLISPGKHAGLMDSIVLVGNFAFLRQSELDALDSGKMVLLPLQYKGKVDFRNNYLRAFCDSNGNKNAPVYLKKYGPSKKVLIQNTIYILDMANRDTTDLKNPAKPHAIMKVLLKYPGIYTFQVSASNLEGCGAPVTTYQVINGHYATYAVPDSVTCTNKPVTFYDKVRYFTMDGNIVGRDFRGVYYAGGLWDQVLAADGIFDEDGIFRPWDVDPVLARTLFNSKWKPKTIFNPEKIEWDFDGDGKIDKPVNGKQHHPVWKYAQPGVYSPIMYTTDSNGCRIKTVLRNFIKIIKPVDSFYTWNDYTKTDTVRICAPHTFKMIDSSYMHKGKNTYFMGRNYFAYIDTIAGTCKADATHPKPYACLMPDTIIVDSFIKRIWDQGDGRPKIVRTANDTVRRFTYTFNDTFTFYHQIVTGFGCSDSILKKNWLVVKGPKPRFTIITPNKGCLPFTLVVKNKNVKQLANKSASYLFDKHDGTTVTTGPDSEYINITFDHLKPKDSLLNRDSSVYSIDLLMTDSVFNPLINAKLKCSALWPDTATRPTDTTFYVVVYRRDTVRIKSDTLFCPNETFVVTARSTKIQTYNNFRWYKDNDTVAFKVGSDTTASLSFSTPGKHRVKVVCAHKYCDPMITYVDVYVDSILANFTVDSFTMGRLGKFTFYDSSVGNRFHGKYLSSTKPSEWFFNVPKDDPNPSLWMDKNPSDPNMRKDTSASIFFDYETVIGTDKDPEKKDFSFKVCLRTYSKRPCPDDTCKIVTFVRDFETYNIFTPGNNDGKNDVFNPKIKGNKYYNIMIFNRWGEKVFESDNPDTDWNGKNFNTGSETPAGTYFYIVKYDLIGKEKGVGQRTGTITLVR